jgi:DNA primase
VKPPPGLQALRRPHRDYLRGRGLDPDIIESLWGVRATGPVGRLAWRLWIPIELDGQIVSWTTRAIGDKQPRYVSAGPGEESIDHKTLLYGEDRAGHSIVVVEGPADVWAIGPGAVAVLGLTTTPQQIERIGSHPVRAVCFDAGAERRASRLAAWLRQYPGETATIRLESGDDPAEADSEEIEELRRRFL